MYSNWHLKKNAQLLRKNMTPQEKHLWYDFLRSHAPQFYRQKTVLRYILDFYCPKVRLAVELDGSQHYEEGQKQYDEKRTEKLKKLGIFVLRFTNKEVDVNFRGVCARIDVCVKELMATSSLTHR